VGGRKFLLAVVGIVAVLIGSLPWVNMDADTKMLIVYIALGGAGIVAIEDIFKRLKG